MPDYGLGLAYGYENMNQDLRQRIMDQLAQKQQGFENEQRLREMALREREAQQRGEFQTEQLQQLRGVRSATEEERRARIAAEGRAGDVQRQQDLEEQGILNDPNTPEPIKGYLRLRHALPRGESVPYQLFQPQKPTETEPVVRVNPRTGQLETLGNAPKGSHFVNEPPPAQGGQLGWKLQPDQAGNLWRINERTGETQQVQTKTPAKFGANKLSEYWTQDAKGDWHHYRTDAQGATTELPLKQGETPQRPAAPGMLDRFGRWIHNLTSGNDPTDPNWGKPK